MKNSAKPLGVPVNFVKIEAKAATMNLSMRAVCRALGYKETYFTDAKTAGVIAVDFVEKFATLTSTAVKDYEVSHPPKEEKKVPQDFGEIMERLENIDAELVSLIRIAKEQAELLRQLAER
jgi:hypothetical protein